MTQSDTSLNIQYTVGFTFKNVFHSGNFQEHFAILEAFGNFIYKVEQGYIERIPDCPIDDRVKKPSTVCLTALKRESLIMFN